MIEIEAVITDVNNALGDFEWELNWKKYCQRTLFSDQNNVSIVTALDTDSDTRRFFGWLKCALRKKGLSTRSVLPNWADPEFDAPIIEARKGTKLVVQSMKMYDGVFTQVTGREDIAEELDWDINTGSVTGVQFSAMMTNWVNARECWKTLMGHLRIGILDDNGRFEPASYFRFETGGITMGRAYVTFHNDEFEELIPSIEMVEVAAPYRNQGFGTQMVYVIERTMSNHDFPAIRSVDSSAGSQNFWKKQGYKMCPCGEVGVKMLNPDNYDVD